MKTIRLFLNAALGLALASTQLSAQAQDPAQEPRPEKKAERLLVFSEGDDLKTIDLDSFQKMNSTERIAFLKERGITHFSLDTDGESFEWTADSAKHTVVDIHQFVGDSAGNDKRMVWIEKGQHPNQKHIRIEHHVDTEALADSAQQKKIRVFTTQPQTIVMVEKPNTKQVEVEVEVEVDDSSSQAKHQAVRKQKKVMVLHTQDNQTDIEKRLWHPREEIDAESFEKLPAGKTHEFKGKNGKVIVERNQDGELKIRFEEKK